MRVRRPARGGLSRLRWPRWALVAAGVLAAVLLVRVELLEPVRIGSDSMAPTLHRGEHVLVVKLGAPRRGDLVAFHSPADGRLTVKRVVAVGGQTVEIRDAVLHVDGSPVADPEPGARRLDGVWFGPVRVPAGELFVLGDNRANSEDSRGYGAVPRASVVGRVLD